MKTKYPYNTYRIALLNLILLVVTSCNEFINVDAPKTEIITENIFASDASATAALNGIYSLMINNTSFTRGGLEEYTGIASDELINYSTNVNRMQFAQNSITSINADVLSVFWREGYKYISNANIILEGLQQPNGMTPEGKLKMEGEALFIRAFCHFYLTNLFGKIPYVTTSSYQVNASLGQSSLEEVMRYIEMDLTRARELMPADYSSFGGLRIRPNRDAAAALLARVYLYQGNWSKAEAVTTDIINNTVAFKILTDLNAVFLANSSEAIWQLMPLTDAPQAQLFVLTGAPNGSGRRVAMSTGLVAAFEANDKRKTNWTSKFTSSAGSWSFINKYKKLNSTTPTEYSTVFRLAEEYLIRAEARANQNNLAGAAADLNVIRNRAGLTNTIAANQTDMLLAVEQERRVELFGEMGHRWIDLRRSGHIDAIMSLIKPLWQTTDAFFPIPASEIILNPVLAQNPGY